MNRVLSDEVVDAYKTTKMVPVRKKWFRKFSGEACALTSCAIAKVGYFEFLDLLAQVGDQSAVVISLSLDSTYMKGFLVGWDRSWSGYVTDEMLSGAGFSTSEQRERFRLGVEDGCAALAAVREQIGEVA